MHRQTDLASVSVPHKHGGLLRAVRVTHAAVLKDPALLKPPPPPPEALKEDPDDAAALGATRRISWPPRTACTSARLPSRPWMPPMMDDEEWDQPRPAAKDFYDTAAAFYDFMLTVTK